MVPLLGDCDAEFDSLDGLPLASVASAEVALDDDVEIDSLVNGAAVLVLSVEVEVEAESVVEEFSMLDELEAGGSDDRVAVA